MSKFYDLTKMSNKEIEEELEILHCQYFKMLDSLLTLREDVDDLMYLHSGNVYV